MARLVNAGLGAWSLRTTPAITFGSVAASGSVVVAVSYSGDTSPVISSTNGLTWTAREAGTANHSWNDVIWVEDWGLFVAVSDTSGETTNVMTSEDGITWVTRTAADTAWYAVAYSPDLGIATAIGVSTSTVLQSNAGTTWTSESATNLPAGKRDIAWGASNFVLVTNEQIHYSADGNDWAEATIPTLTLPILSPRVTYAGDQFVVAAYDNTGIGPYGILLSDDGVTWTFTEFTGAMATFASDVTFPCAMWDATNSRFYLMKSNGDYAYTTNFTSWTTGTSGAGDWYDLIWVPSLARLIAGGVDGAGEDIQTATYSAVPFVDGLDHLAGETISMSAYGPTMYVPGSDDPISLEPDSGDPPLPMASPYNSDYDPIIIVDEEGKAELPEGTYSLVVIGLPYVTDIQTLDIDTSGGTLKPQKFLITNVGAYLEASKGFFAGPEEPTTATGLTLPSGGSMQELQVLDRDENTATDPQTGFRSLNFEGRWSESGSVFIRNIDPTPLTVLALVPYGKFPER